MKLVKIISLYLLLALNSPPIFSSAQTQNSELSICAPISDEVNKWNRSFASGNLPSLVESYAEGAILFPPGNDAIKNKENTALFFEAAINAGVVVKVETRELKCFGEYAHEIGVAFTFIPKNGTSSKKVLSDESYYMILWKKSAEGWKIFRDIWSHRKLSKE